MAKDSFDCGADAMVPLDDALAILSEQLNTVAGTEVVPLSEALGRTLARDQLAEIAVPEFNNSAVDGWAAFFDDVSPTGEARLQIGDRVAAGPPLAGEARRGFAYPIFTGAPVPAGVDLVAMQEHCRKKGGLVVLPAGLRRGENIRVAGESVRCGDIPMTAGIRLAAQHLGIAASLGRTSLPVRRRLRVAAFSSGDEVIEPGQRLTPGHIYDANRFLLIALLKNLECAVHDLGILPDQADAVQERLVRAASSCDLILTSGGMAVGEKDYIRAAVQSAGNLHFWRLALKPGKPLALGQIGDAVFLGLPGNPVAAMVAFLLFAKPLIARLGGMSYKPPRRYTVTAGFALKKKAGRREFPRASIMNTALGPVARLFRTDGSNVLTSMTETDGLIDIPQRDIEIFPGDSVAFLPFSELMN